jgi:hypothetical protein
MVISKMPNTNCQLRAMVVAREGGVEAQLLELDIAAMGRDVPDLLNEIRHALIVTYEIAKELGETPFTSVMPHPAYHFQSRCDDDDSGEEMGTIELPENVGEALAAALHALKPIRAITVYNKAA